MQRLPPRTNAVTFANYCHKFGVKAKLGPKFAPVIDLSWHQPRHPKTFIQARNQFAKRLKVGLTCPSNHSAKFDRNQKRAFWLKHKISNSSGGQHGQISMAVLAKRFVLGAPQMFSNIWCPSDVFKHLVPARAGVLVKQYLDFICIFVLIVFSLSEKTICKQ